MKSFFPSPGSLKQQRTVSLLQFALARAPSFFLRPVTALLVNTSHVPFPSSYSLHCFSLTVSFKLFSFQTAKAVKLSPPTTCPLPISQLVAMESCMWETQASSSHKVTQFQLFKKAIYISGANSAQSRLGSAHTYPLFGRAVKAVNPSWWVVADSWGL